MMKLRTTLAAVGAVMLLVGGAPAEETAKRGLAPGDVLGKDNWQLAEGLLPPEILEHYREGGYVNPIVEWPADVFTWPPDFHDGSKSNEGRFDIGEHGEIIEKATGKQPEYLIGFPFPSIDPQDPRAADKILWNFFYRTWYWGNSRNPSQLNWVKPSGLERRVDVDVSFRYYDGIPAYQREQNAQNFSAQFLTVVTSPADVNGTANLTWRFRDPTKRDNSWAYVPALRRVRAVSPANRSDGFLGSDMSQDDGPFFDGKPEDFTWTLASEMDQFRLVDPLSLKGQFDAAWLPQGGWRANWPELDFLGYMDEEWKGVGWAPLTGALALRRHWVLKGVPKDRYYLYGQIELYIDKITFQGSWNRKFSWNGELLNTLQVMAFIPKAATRPNGQVDYVQGSNMAFQCAENIKQNQATVAGIKSSPKSGFDSHIMFEPSFFEMTSLSRFGK
jgi:hypothetical protein